MRIDADIPHFSLDKVFFARTSKSCRKVVWGMYGQDFIHVQCQDMHDKASATGIYGGRCGASTGSSNGFLPNVLAFFSQH